MITPLPHTARAFGADEGHADAHYNKETNAVVITLRGIDNHHANMHNGQCDVHVMSPKKLATQDQITIAIDEYGDEELRDEMETLTSR